jgi:hypothetical protein
MVFDEQVARGIVHCPYLQALKDHSGQACAVRIAYAVLKDVRGVPALDASSQEAFRAAHGPDSPFPILKESNSSRCPFARLSCLLQKPAHAAEGGSCRPDHSRTGLIVPPTYGSLSPAAQNVTAPYASISLSGFWVRFGCTSFLVPVPCRELRKWQTRAFRCCFRKISVRGRSSSLDATTWFPILLVFLAPAFLVADDALRMGDAAMMSAVIAGLHTF